MFMAVSLYYALQFQVYDRSVALHEKTRIEYVGVGGLVPAVVFV